MFYFLKKNIEDNNINAIAVNKGLSDKCEKLFLGPPRKRQHPRYQRDRGRPGLYSVYADKFDKWTFKRGEVCDFITLDAFCEKNSIKKIDFIKIDVEGHELMVLQGGLNSIQKYRPILKIELNLFTLSIANTDPKYIFNYFDNLKYNIYIIQDGEFVEKSCSDIIGKDDFLNGDIYAFPFEKNSY